MIESNYTNIIITNTYNVDNSKKNIIGMSAKNLSTTNSVFFDGLEIKPGESAILIAISPYPKTNNNITIDFKTNSLDNKVFLSIDRIVRVSC